MSRRRALARWLALPLVVVLTNGLSTPAADAIPPCWTQPVPPPDCPEPPPPPPPPDPGPIGHEVRLYENDPSAVPAANAVLAEVLGHIEPATRSRMLARYAGITAHIAPDGQDPTDVPLWEHLRGVPLDYDPTLAYDDALGISSPGCTGDVVVRERWVVSVGNVPPPEPEELGRVLAHEVGHEVMCAGLSEPQRTRVAELRDAARSRFLDGDPSNDDVVGAIPDYTVYNEDEFFAEATAAWFDMGAPDSTYRRDWVRQHDEALYALLDEIYTAAPTPVYCHHERATTRVTTAGTVTGSPGRDVVVGSSGADTIDGAGDEDVICGRGGDDTITGGSGNDDLYGEAGADDLRGGDGNDRMIGGLGDDHSDGGNGDDFLNDDIAGNPTQPAEPGDGDDRLSGGPGNDDMYGGIADDVFNDTLGRDNFSGDAGRDEIFAVDLVGFRMPSIPDVLDGGTGDDFCTYDGDDTVYSCFIPGHA
jgi:hypothetical protein